MRRGNVLILVAGIIALVGIGIAGFFFWKTKQTTETPLTWETCIKTPGAINQLSYPGICHLPDGRSVVQPLSEEEKRKLIPPPGVSCPKDTDCVLVNEDVDYGCRFNDLCEPVDYSLDKWIAVSVSEQQTYIDQKCPDIRNTQMPACFPKPINDQYIAKCVANQCQKKGLAPTTGGLKTIYTCPQNGWVNCMPILTEEGKKACSQEAMDWYKKNCPNFQGGAL